MTRLGSYVRAFYASDQNATHCEGEVVAIAEFPTYDIVTASGEHVNWAAHLTEEIPAPQRTAPQPSPTDPGLLTPDEHRAVAMAGDLWNLLCEITTHGLARQGDLQELIAHIHGIQRAVLKQAAARAYPELYRLLGGDPPPLPTQWPNSETVTELQAPTARQVDDSARALLDLCTAEPGCASPAHVARCPEGA